MGSLLERYNCTGQGATEKWFCAAVIGNGGKHAKAHQQMMVKVANSWKVCLCQNHCQVIVVGVNVTAFLF